MFFWHKVWNRYSSPIRRAGSPQQPSSVPSIPNLTPAVFSIFTIALDTLTFRSSSAPVQPTQYSISTLLSSAIVFTSRPSAHAVLVKVVPRPGWSRVLKFLSASSAHSGSLVCSWLDCAACRLLYRFFRHISGRLVHRPGRLCSPISLRR